MLAKTDGPHFGKVDRRAHEHKAPKVGIGLRLLMVWVALLLLDGFVLAQPTGYLNSPERAQAVRPNIRPQRPAAHGDQPDNRTPAPVRPVLRLDRPSPASPVTGQSVRFLLRTGGHQGELAYQFYFGDGTTSGWINTPTTQHAYSQAGPYTVYAEARRTGSVPQLAALNPAPITSNAVTLQVREPDVPLRAQLVVAPVRAHPGEAVDLAVEVAPSQPGTIQCSFEFGDGTPSAWTLSRSVRHVYARAGTYRASALVRSGRPQPGAVTFDGGLARTNVVSVEIVPSPAPSQLVLSAQPSGTRVGAPVVFQVELRPPQQGDIRYQFVFADGTAPQWGPQDRLQHAFSRAGTYPVFALAQLPVYPSQHLSTAPETLRSNTVNVQVIEDKPSRAALLVQPPVAHPGDEVVFQMRMDPQPSGEARYRFDFGDGGQRGMSADASARHRYAAARTYRVVAWAQVRGGEEKTASLSYTVSPQSASPPPVGHPRPPDRGSDGTRLLAAAGILAAGALALVLTWKLTRRLRQRGPLVRPRTRLRPHEGSQYIDGVPPTEPDLVVRLRVRTAPGEHSIEAAGDIISEEGIRHE